MGAQKVARGGALVGLLLQMRMLLRPFPRSAFGCSSRDARWTRAQSLPWEHLRAAQPEMRRAPIAPPEGTNMVPPQLPRKMSVLSVDPPAPWAPGQIAAGRAHRPGSRRLGGVEAPGASPATGASWPDRRKGWASPGRGPVLPISRVGCVDLGCGRGRGPIRNLRPWAGACSVNHGRALRVQTGVMA